MTFVLYLILSVSFHGSVWLRIVGSLLSLDPQKFVKHYKDKFIKLLVDEYEPHPVSYFIGVFSFSFFLVIIKICLFFS